MGRWSYSNKCEADHLKNISTAFLKKHGYFNKDLTWRTGTVTWSVNGEKTGDISIEVNINENEPSIRFVYTQTDRNTGEKKDFNYKTKLTTTPCNYGGKRYWFICSLWKNGNYCGRRVGTLYKGGDYFGCRHCYDLTYSSCNENKRFRSGAFGILNKHWKAEEYEGKIKRKFYNGKPTRRYKRYLKMDGFSDIEMELALKELNKSLMI